MQKIQGFRKEQQKYLTKEKLSEIKIFALLKVQTNQTQTLNLTLTPSPPKKKLSPPTRPPKMPFP